MVDILLHIYELYYLINYCYERLLSSSIYIYTYIIFNIYIYICTHNIFDLHYIYYIQCYTQTSESSVPCRGSHCTNRCFTTYLLTTVLVNPYFTTVIPGRLSHRCFVGGPTARCSCPSTPVCQRQVKHASSK